MPWLLAGYLVAVFIGGAGAVSLAVFTWGQRRIAPGRAALSVWLVGIAIWCVTYLIFLLSSDFAGQAFWFRAQYLGTMLLPPAALVFALQLTGNDRRVTPWLLALLTIEPIVSWVMILTNDTHHLMWTVFRADSTGVFPPFAYERGLWSQARLMYLYAVQAGAYLILFRSLPGSSILYRRQTTTLLFGAIFPWTGSLISAAAVLPFGKLDLTPGAFAVTVLIWAWGVLRQGLFDLVPAARFAMIDDMVEAAMVVDVQRRLIDANPAAFALLGRRPIACLGQPVDAVFDRWPDLVKRLREDAEDASDLEIEVGAEPRTLAFRVAPWRDGRGHPMGHLIWVRDVTARKRAGEALAYQALYDPLTGLANRAALTRDLEQALGRRGGPPPLVALLLLDLNGFRDVNQTFGHATGDALLRRVAQRIQQAAGPGETAARLGGDEFAVVIPMARSVDDVTAVAGRIIAALETPFVVDNVQLGIGASMGIALYPEHGEDSASLLRQADVALYAAKRSGTAFALYQPSTDPRNPTRLALLAELRGAIAEDNLVLHYQPQVDVHTGRVRGVEALVRWQHPQLGLLAPDEFIPMAERSGLIQPLTHWVLTTALQQAAAWRQEGLHLPVAINLSMANLLAPNLSTEIEEQLTASELPPEDLTVELTENLVMSDPDQALDVLARLRRLGVRIALDDFGIGQSSLAWLHRLPVDEIKVDKLFVGQMRSEPEGSAIVRLTVEVGHHLDLLVVAEGVDNEESLRLLRAMGCDVAQGFVICHPLPPDLLANWLHRLHPPGHWQADAG